MAAQSKPKTTRKVASKKKQDEGKTAPTGEMSDRAIQVSPDKSKDRGIGSSFAYAVGEVLAQAKEMKGSQSNFLGVPSEVIDPKQYAQSLQGKKESK